MARDVDQALQDIARAHGDLAPDEAAAFAARLAAEGRYLRDVY
jgi:sulfite reductase alpha subunit-like flavoprotein